MGLDLSTTTVGYAVVESDDMSLVELGHLSLKNVKGLFEKAEYTSHDLTLKYQQLGAQQIWIEEPVSRFTPGMSSAHTIVTLMRFNGIISYELWNLFKNVQFVKPGEARRTCGIILTTRAKAGGLGQKEQTFSQLTSATGLLSSWVYAKTRTDKPKPEAYDEADAYVIARHGAVVASRR